MTPCILCETVQRTALYHYHQSGQACHFVICEGCGLASIDPVPSAAQLAEQYVRGEFSKEIQPLVLDQKKQSALKSSTKFLRLLKTCRQVTGQDFTDRMLIDIGCGFGRLSASLAETFPAAKVVGLEPEAAVVELLRSLNQNPRIRIDTGVVETVAMLPTDQVAGLFLFDVFEHLPNPLDDLRLLNGASSENGWIFILLPDLMDPGSVFGPRSFFHTGHMYYYTDRTLGALLARAGFEPRMTIRDENTVRATGHGVMVAAQKVQTFAAAASIPGEADRVRRRLRAVRWQTAIAGPVRYFYRYHVRRPLHRQASAVKHLVLGNIARRSV